MSGKRMAQLGSAIIATMLLCTLGSNLTAAPATPTAEYASIKKEYDDAQKAASKAYQAAKTEEDKKKANAQFPNRAKFAERFLALAEKHSDSRAALDALLWVATECYYLPEGEKALDTLARDHAQSDKLENVCDRLIYTQSEASQRFLRAVIEKNPKGEIQGKAHFALGKQAVATSEADRLLNLVIEKYGNVKYGSRTLGEAAKGELYEVHHLAIGKVAPEIEGADVDGKKFKLSDYRGRVVVLDFWGDW